MSDRPYTVQELASRYGCPLSVITGMVRKKQIPAFSVGRRKYRISAEAVAGCDTLDQLQQRYSDARPFIAEYAQAIALLMARTIDAYPKDGGFIYFIKCQHIVKMGYSMDPGFRCRALASVIPFELTALGHVRGSEQAEKALHEAFREIQHYLLDEWFNLSDDLEAAIKAVTA